MADEGSQGSGGEFFVLRYGEIHPDSGFYHDQVTAHLAQGNPTCFLKSPGGFLAGDVAESAHGSDSHHNGLLSRLGR